MLQLALSVALATCPTPPEGVVPTDDAELVTALDAADRAAWALRDAETLLFARRAWNARLDRLRAAGEATAHDDIEARIVERLGDLVATTTTPDGAFVATGGVVAGVPMPDLRGLDLLSVDEALVELEDEATALAEARAARIADVLDPCGGMQVVDPGPAAATGPWGDFVEAASEVHLAQQAAGALAKADHGAATFEGAVARMRQLAVASASETLDDGHRAFIQSRFEELSFGIDAIAARQTWHGHPLHSGVAADVELPDLTAPSLGVDTGAIDLSTSAGASAAIPALDFALVALTEARDGYAADLANLDLEPPAMPRPSADGAIVSFDCATVTATILALTDADDALAGWDTVAREHQRLLVQLQAGQLRWQSQVRTVHPEIPDPSWHFSTLSAGPPAVELDVAGLHDVLSIAVPGLDLGPRPSSEPDGLRSLPEIVDTRAALATDRQRVHSERLGLRLEAIRLGREAHLCHLPPPQLPMVAAPGDPSEHALEVVMRLNRRDAEAFIAASNEARDSSWAVVVALYQTLGSAWGRGVEPSRVEDELLAQSASLAPSPQGWEGIRFDARRTLWVPLSDDGIEGMPIPVEDLTLEGLRVDVESWLAEGSSATPEGLLSLWWRTMDALDVLDMHRLGLDVPSERLQLEASLAQGD